jgi:anthranilate synthase component 2
MKMLFVDNIDSFTYNVVHLLAGAGFDVDVVRNDDASLAPALLGDYDALAIGPGPGKPSDLPRVAALIRTAMEERMPLFGLCLGLQAIGEVCGARVVHAPAQMHGKVSAITHDGSGLFAGIPSPFRATRYHSLCLDPATIPPAVRVVARSDDGVVQAIMHERLPVHAVQFHPESVLSDHGDRLAANLYALCAAVRHDVEKTEHVEHHP